jgi:hypothetical protein
MNRTTSIGILLACIVAGFAPNHSLGAATTYFGIDPSKLDLTNSNAARNSFVAALGSFAEETMEGFAVDTPDPVLFAGTPFEATSDFDRVVAFAPVAVSGSNALLDAGPPAAGGTPVNDVVQFSQPITAFGSYFGQGGDGVPNVLTLRLENTSLGTSRDVTVTLGPGAPFFNIAFFGVTDTDPFDRVTMLESEDFDGILLDNTVAGHVVPEPDALALLALGTCLAWFARRAFRKV